jgi:hypothetical protein
MGTFTVDGWRTTGQTTIDGGNITAGTITADAIKTSTLNAKTITLGTTGGDSIIKSGNYSAGSAGWQIKANGDAEFNNVTVRGAIGAATIQSEAIITVAGYLYSDNYTFAGGAITAGWYIDGYNGSIQARGIDVFAGGLTCFGGVIGTNDTGYFSSKKYSLKGSGTFTELTVSADGLHLYWKDNGGTTHTIV